MRFIASVGTYGSKVAILQRGKGSNYYLRWLDKETKKYRLQATEYRVLTKAKVAAMAKANDLIQTTQNQPSRTPRTPKSVVTWGRLLAWYEEIWFPLASSDSERENNPRVIALWRHVLPLEEPVEQLEPAVLTRFIQQRKEGGFAVGTYQFAAKVSDRTVGKDLEWLRRVVNKGIQSPNLNVKYNPVRSVPIPDTPSPKRPVASVARWEALRARADGVGSQGLFGGFLDLLRALGWRVRALCEIRLEDIDTAAWRIRKLGEVDKEGHDVWVAVSDSLKPRLKALLKVRRTLSVQSPWLFPKPEKPAEPWSRHYARDRLGTAERAAKLKPIDGGDFHPYRRLWARLLKDQPTGNVAAAGAWRTTGMVQLYQGLVTEDEVATVMNAIAF